MRLGSERGWGKEKNMIKVYCTKNKIKTMIFCLLIKSSQRWKGRMNIATEEVVLYLREEHIKLILTEYKVLIIALY